jgi:hypothetical protein
MEFQDVFPFYLECFPKGYKMFFYIANKSFSQQ